MSKKKPKRGQPKKEPRRKTPTLLLELPLVVNEEQAKRIRGHLEAGRALYNAVLSEGQKRLRLAHECVQQRANEGQRLPRSMGLACARARRPESRSEPTPEPAFLLRRGRLEAW